MHVEVVTNIVPTMNDDEEQLNGIAKWMHDDLGELTPWHVTRFYPNYQLSNLPATPLDNLDRAALIGRDAGLHFVYLGNVPSREDNTLCYRCGGLVVRRRGYDVTLTGLSGSKCKYCGTELNFRQSVGPVQNQAPGEAVK